MDKIEVTQADRTLYHQLLSLGSVNLNRRRMGLPIVDGFELIAAHRLATRTDATPVAEAWEVFEAAMKDPEYAWGWHCNLAVPIIDATGITHEQANMAAAHLMQHLWKCDITTHPHYQYEKSGAQSYAEFRIEADKAEDAVLPDATHPPATDVAALVGVLAKGGFMMTETHNIGEHRARKLVIGFQNGRDADLAMEAVAIAIKAYRDAT